MNKKHWKHNLQCRHSCEPVKFPRYVTQLLHQLLSYSEHSSLYETVCAWVCVCIYIFMNSTWSPPFASQFTVLFSAVWMWRDERSRKAKEGRTSVSSELSPALFFISFHLLVFQRDWTIKESNHYEKYYFPLPWISYIIVQKHATSPPHAYVRPFSHSSQCGFMY